MSNDRFGRARAAVVWLLAFLAVPAFALAQGTQTGTLTGTVTSSDGAPLPGVTVTVRSPSLVGERTTTTTTNGDFIVKGLPAGSYQVAFELTGFARLEKSAAVSLGTSATVTATMGVAAVQESVVVTADAPSVVEATQAGATFDAAEVDTLATGRTLDTIAELAPGLTDNTPNAGQVTVAGGFAYDNLFLIDGVDVTDSTFGTANDVFIEDAIEETQVLTSGVSAEFGRFGGGAINAVTKRGGNSFSGSFRTDFTNASWRDETPFEVEEDITRESNLNQAYQATLGGPIVRNRLWFFAAGRVEERSRQDTFPFSGVPFVDETDDKRFQGKLTGTLAPNHTLQAAYTRNRTSDTAPTFDFSIAPSTNDVTENPQELFVANYTGVLRSNLFTELQYSHSSLGFRDGNGTDTNVATGSPIFTFGNSAAVPAGQHYNAPYFDYGTDPQDRYNHQVTGSLSYFLSTASLGRHDLKVGFEHYRNSFEGGNSQSPTNYVFYADYATDAAGNPVLDPAGNLTPVFETFGGLFLNWLPERGAKLQVRTTSLFLNDRWQLGDRWTFNVGVRYERVRSETTSSNLLGLDTDTVVPRLAVAYDVTGDGRISLQGSYSHYAGSYNLSQFGNNQGAGNPSLVYAIYAGPPGQGLDFAPGFDPANYAFLGAGLPSQNISFDPDLSSPVNREFTLSAGTRLGADGYLKLVYTRRRLSSVVEAFQTFDLGTVEATTPSACAGCAGPLLLDRILYDNTDVPMREYDGLQLQASYTINRNWRLTGHYTYQIHNHGDFEGENTNQPAVDSTFGDYPEIMVPERNFPQGRLNDFQRHKARAWTTYDLRLGRFGGFNVGLLWRYDSALTYSLTAANQPVTDIQLARDPGYAQPPQLQTIYFGERGVGSFEGAHLFDLALTYDIPVYRSLRPYVKLDVRNIFNDQTLGAGIGGTNTTISPDEDGPRDANGIPTTFTRSPSFGEAVANNSYPIPRELRLAVGFRF
jgi:outer membrane receptor protein involved in Fe transport